MAMLFVKNIWWLRGVTNKKKSTKPWGSTENIFVLSYATPRLLPTNSKFDY